jgi:hypothetical protein
MGVRMELNLKIRTVNIPNTRQAVERRERVIKLRLANEAKRAVLEELRRRTITIAECVETMDRIKRVVSADPLGLPVNLCHKLANREPQYIQKALHAVFHSALARLGQAETYLGGRTTGLHSPKSG